jgi:hypothetical protein
MKTFDFVRSAHGLSRKEKSILTNRLVPLLQHRINLSLEHQCHIEEKMLQVRWGEDAYGTMESTRSFAAHFVNNTRTYFENCIYDLNWQSLDTNRDGKILGFQFGKETRKRITPVAVNILPEIDVIASLLGYTKVPVESLNRRIDLGGGVVAAFRPPRSDSYTFSVWVRKESPGDKLKATLADQSSLPTPPVSTITPSLPPFNYIDYSFYATSRNAIENRFTAVETNLFGKLLSILWNAQLFINRVLSSELGSRIADVIEYMHHLVSHVANKMYAYASKASHEETPSAPHQHFSSLHCNISGGGGQSHEHKENTVVQAQSQQGDVVDKHDQQLDKFWAVPSSPFDSKASVATPEMSIDDIIPRQPVAPLHLATRPQGDKSHGIKDNDLLQSVIVGVSCVDPLYGHHMTLKLLKSLTLNDIPLIVPDPSPAAGSRSRHHRLCTLRLARAELVIFTAILVAGALPAAYRSINFVLEHPVYAQMVSASLIGTLLYTAWNSRRNIRSYATLRISDAIAARLVAQDETALDNIMNQFVEAYAESMVLIYTSELLHRHQQELLELGEHVPTAAENEEVVEFLHSPKFASALNGGGWFAEGTSPFIREKMESIGLLKDGVAVPLEEAERAILGEDIDISPQRAEMG